MASLQQILSWFKEGLFPSENQFKDAWTSFWHKSEKIPQEQIFGLKETIEASSRGLIYQNPVATFNSLETTYPEAKSGWAAMVQDEGFIYAFNGSLPWANTGLKAFPEDVALNGGSTKTLKEVETEIVQLAGETDLLIDSNRFIQSEDRIISQRSNWINSGYISSATHLPVETPNYVYSDFKPILPFSKLRCYGFTGSSTVIKLEIFDKNKTSILSVVNNLGSFSVIAPENSTYVRYCDATNSNAKVEIIDTIQSRLFNAEKTSFLNIKEFSSPNYELLSKLNSAIKSINIIGADANKKYAIASFDNRNSSLIRIFDSDIVEVARFVSNSSFNEIKEIQLEQINNSGIDVRMIVDFTSLQNFEVSSTFSDKAEINSLAFKNQNYEVFAQEFVNRDNLNGIKLDALSDSLTEISSAEFVNVGYINNTTNNYSVNNEYRYSKKYPVKPNREIYLLNFKGSASVTKCRFFDKYDNLIPSSKLTTDYSALLRSIAPANARYVEFCCLHNEAGVEVFPKAKVIFKPKKGQRKSATILSKKSFRQAGTIIENNKIKVIGGGSWLNYMFSDFETLLEKSKCGVSFIMSAFDNSSNFGLRLTKKYRSSIISIEIDNTNFKVVRNYEGVETIEHTEAHGISFVAGLTSSIFLEKNTDGSIVQIRAEGVEKTFNMSNAIFDWLTAQQFGEVILSVKSGTFFINDIFLKSGYDLTPEIFVKGDSLVEGNSLVLTGAALQDRWVSKLAQFIGIDKVVISAIGGLALEERTLLNMVIENDYFKSKYYLIELATNNYKFGFDYFKTLLDVFISYLKFNGQIPILMTVCPIPAPSGEETNYLNFRTSYNEYVRNSGELFIDANRALTKDDSTWKPGMVMGDGTHYTVAGNLAVFERIKIDVPELM